MEITPKFNNLNGSFNTTTEKLVCHAPQKYQTVELCFDGNCLVTFAVIKLFSKGFDAQKEVFDDAKNLGNEIVRRWNNHAPCSINEIRDEFECWYLSEFGESQVITKSDLCEYWVDENKGYVDCDVDIAWESWKASRKKSLGVSS